MEGETDAVDALFAEAFALLDRASSSSSSPCSSSDAASTASTKRANAPETSASKLKRSIQALCIEEQQLRAQLERLRGHVAPSCIEHQDRALAARVKRRSAERECQQLRAAVYTHTQFLRGLRSLFTDCSRAALSLNLCHQLHNFTRLPKDRSIRALEFTTLRRDERVDAAIDLVLRETSSLSNARDFVDATFVHAPDEPCAITSTSLFVMDDYDVPTVLRAACVAIRDIIVRCRSYEWVGVAGEIVDAESLSQSNLQYRVTNIRRSAVDDRDAFSVESRALTMYRMVGDAAVVLWDFVDEDELHPLDDPVDITRQSVGASLIRREVCPDGIERTVYRELSTRRYAYRKATSPPPSVAWYLSSQRLSMQWNELLFREIMLEQIAADVAFPMVKIIDSAIAAPYAPSRHSAAEMATEHDDLDAHFAKAFALFEEPPPPVSSSAVPYRRETNAARIKRSIRALRVEEQALHDQLNSLRSHVPPQFRVLHTRARMAQYERQCAERKCKQLRAAVYAQTQFLRGLRSVLVHGSPSSLRLDLCQHLHNYTGLPVDPALRQIDYDALVRGDRVDAALDMLLRETHAISNAHDFVDAAHDETATAQSCSITSTRVLVLSDDCDVPTALRAACVAVRKIVATCRGCRWVGLPGGSLVDAETLSPSPPPYRLTSLRRISDEGEEFSVEARVLAMYKRLGDAAVVLWDFVDDDQLKALDAPAEIVRQGVGACLLRREVCPDDVERTVYRELCTRRYLYQASTPPPATIARYFAAKRTATGEYEQLFRDILRHQIAQEMAGPSY